MPRRKPNLDFQIHVDRSCLVESMDSVNLEHTTNDSANMDDLVDIIDGELKQHERSLEGNPSPDVSMEPLYSKDDGGAEDLSIVSEAQEHSLLSHVESDNEEEPLQYDEGSILDNQHSFVNRHRGQEDNDELLMEEEPYSSIEGDSTHSHQSNGDRRESDSILHLHQEADVRDFAHNETSASVTPSQRPSNISDRSRKSSQSPRKASGRTEALIHAAAKDIVAKIEHDRSHGETEEVVGKAGHDQDAHESIETEEDGHYTEDSFMAGSRQASNHQSVENQSRVHKNPSEYGDSSSHHENEASDDVFSDHSPRSSMGSASASDNEYAQKPNQSFDAKTSRSSRYSSISTYDHNEDFVPTARGTPGPPFRSPSSVKAIQMSSPSPSILGSPRSSRRTPMPTVSRIGSPSYRAQYSPKKTPPRFKRNTPPLVLLHVTLVPLNWGWGQVLEKAHADDLSEDGKTLREAWRLLDDRMGGNVLDRGILLPHPQNDYEVLEERLLEALELPMRRRARILECGHYLGPANEHTLLDESESEAEDDGYPEEHMLPRQSLKKNSHWCKTCRSEIKFDALGPGKIFRVKVYASNGLMRAGAWEACWREMERVDVEIEPIVDSKAQEELEMLALTQIDDVVELEEDQGEEEVVTDDDEEDHEESFLAQVEDEDHTERLPEMPSSPPEIRIDSSSVYDDRRRQDEDRLREIYGHTPPPASPPSSSSHLSPEPVQYRRTPSPNPSHLDTPTCNGNYETTRDSAPSPSFAAFQRREERRSADGTAAHKSATLPELLLEAVRVLFQDSKNIMIGMLSLMVLVLALRGGTKLSQAKDFAVMEGNAVRDALHIPTVNLEPDATAADATFSKASASEAAPTQSLDHPESLDPCSSLTAGDAHETISEVVRVVQTVTETSYETTTSTVIQTETQIPLPFIAIEDDSVDNGSYPQTLGDQTGFEDARILENVGMEAIEAEV